MKPRDFTRKEYTTESQRLKGHRVLPFFFLDPVPINRDGM